LNGMFRRLISFNEPNKILTDTANTIDEKPSLDHENLGIEETMFKACNKTLGE